MGKRTGNRDQGRGSKAVEDLVWGQGSGCRNFVTTKETNIHAGSTFWSALHLFCCAGSLAGTPQFSRYRRHRDLFCDCHLHRLLPEGLGKYQRRVLHGGPGNDGVDCGPEFCFRQPRIARADGLGGIGVSVRNSGDALVLDRRNPGDAFSRHHHDAVLLHLEGQFGSRVSAPADTATARGRCRR